MLLVEGDWNRRAPGAMVMRTSVPRAVSSGGGGSSGPGVGEDVSVAPSGTVVATRRFLAPQPADPDARIPDEEHVTHVHLLVRPRRAAMSARRGARRRRGPTSASCDWRSGIRERSSTPRRAVRWSSCSTLRASRLASTGFLIERQLIASIEVLGGGGEDDLRLFETLVRREWPDVVLRSGVDGDRSARQPAHRPRSTPNVWLFADPAVAAAPHTNADRVIRVELDFVYRYRARSELRAAVVIEGGRELRFASDDLWDAQVLKHLGLRR